MHPDAIIAIAASANSRGADARRSSAARSAGCRGSGPGFELGLLAARVLPQTNPKLQGRGARRATACSPGATTPKACYETTHRASSTAPSTGSTRETPGKPAFGGAARRRRCRRPSGAPSRRALMPAIRGMISADEPQGRAFRRRSRRCWSSSTSSELRAAGRARHLLPRPFPAHQDPPAGGRLRSGAAGRRRDARRPRRGASRPIAPTTPPITSAASTPTRPPMRDPNAGGLSGARRRHDHLRQGQGDGAHRRRVLRQRHQRDARRRRRLDAIVGLPEQEAFDIEYWLLEEAKLQRMPKPKSAGRPGRAGHRRRRRHRPRDRRAAAGRRRLRGAGRHRRERARRGRRRARASATARTWCAAS